jgi:hypothetical protein
MHHRTPLLMELMTGAGVAEAEASRKDNDRFAPGATFSS